jgi:hypothetical protein
MSSLSQESSYPAKSTNFQETILDGEMILYSTISEQAVYLNESSRLIWGLCDGKRSIQDVINMLREAYSDADSSIGKEVSDAIASMQENGVLLINVSPMK